MAIPNLITVFRLVLVPIVILLILGAEWRWAFALFVIAGISDGLDGYVARKFDLRSELGAFLDPLADKILLLSVFITLAIVGAVPAWFAIVIVLRDVLIALGFMISWVMAQPMKVRPFPLGKAATALQIVFAAFVLGAAAFAPKLAPFIAPFAIIIALLTIATAGLYLARWLKHMTREGRSDIDR